MNNLRISIDFFYYEVENSRKTWKIGGTERDFWSLHSSNGSTPILKELASFIDPCKSVTLKPSHQKTK